MERPGGRASGLRDPGTHPEARAIRAEPGATPTADRESGADRGYGPAWEARPGAIRDTLAARPPDEAAFLLEGPLPRSPTRETRPRPPRDAHRASSPGLPERLPCPDARRRTMPRWCELEDQKRIPPAAARPEMPNPAP